MSTITNSSRPPVCRRASPADRHRALSLLLTGAESGDPQAVETFLGTARDQRVDLDQLWVAEHMSGALTVSLLLVPAAGRTAMVFLSPISRHGIDDASLLVQACVSHLDGAKTRIVQALLDSWQDQEEESLHRAGFERLAHLLYLQRSLDPMPALIGRPDRLVGLDPQLQVLKWSDASRPMFERAILASYEQTLDCPGLVGLRTIDDILESHRASGVFTPELWFVLAKAGEPVGVMLINLSREGTTSELVYLGLAPAWRGKGLGRRLMLNAIELTARRGCHTMLTAVDEGNPAAVRLYESLAFTPNARKLAMLHALA